MADLNLPDQEIFTREQLSKRWKCEQFQIDAYIESGQLKEALRPVARKDLHDWVFYRCSDTEPLSDAFKQGRLIDEGDGSKWLLQFIEDGEPLEKYIGRARQEKIIHCPNHLYMLVEGDAIIKRDDQDYSMVRYFCDLHGNALIPLEEAEDGYRICFAPVKKEHLALLIIRIEEVRRFTGEENKDSSTFSAPKEKEKEIEKELGTLPLKTTDKVSEDKRPPIPDRLIKLPEVRKRTGLARPTIYKKMREGIFPQKQKRGVSTFWKESEINAYVDGTWKPADEAESNE